MNAVRCSGFIGARLSGIPVAPHDAHGQPPDSPEAKKAAAKRPRGAMPERPLNSHAVKGVRAMACGSLISREKPVMTRTRATLHVSGRTARELRPRHQDSHRSYAQCGRDNRKTIRRTIDQIVAQGLAPRRCVHVHGAVAHVRMMLDQALPDCNNSKRARTCMYSQTFDVHSIHTVGGRASSSKKSRAHGQARAAGLDDPHRN